MSNEPERTYKEGKNLFADPKFARAAWRSVGQAILNNPAQKLPQQVDKDGMPTLASDIEQFSYRELMKNIKDLQKQDREPTELEMIMACQIHKARFDTQAAIFVRDTVGAKPVDETKLEAHVVNEYESLTDAELEALAAMRKEKQCTSEHIAEECEKAKEESKGDIKW